MSSNWVFDQKHYELLNAARADAVKRLLTDLKSRLSLRTVIDVGCGVGFYASLLHDLGFDVLAVDGRPENVEEGRNRYPHLKFEVADAQDPSLAKLGQFDLVFCLGLLYHLENPFRVIRSFAELTSKATIVEGMVYPSPEPAMVLLDENDNVDQGLNFMAFYASEACLVKMLRRSGFAHCYLPSPMPAHADFQPGPSGFRRRSMMFASKSAVQSTALTAWPEPSPLLGPFSMAPLYPARGSLSRLYDPLDKLLFGKARKLDRH